MLGAGEGRAGTISFKWKASSDTHIHPFWPEAENPTHLQHLRGLCSSSHPVPSSYSCICFPGSKSFVRQIESRFPRTWAKRCKNLVCFSSFTFCSQMVVLHPGKEQGMMSARTGVRWISTAPSLRLCAVGWVPQDTAPAAMHWLGRCLSNTVSPWTRQEDIWVLFAWWPCMSHFQVHISASRGPVRHQELNSALQHPGIDFHISLCHSP